MERTHGNRESALSTPRRVRAVVVGRARDHVLVRPDLHFPPFFERAMAHRGMDDLSCRLVFRIKRLLRDDAEREQCVRHVKHFLLAQALQQRKVDGRRPHSLAHSLSSRDAPVAGTQAIVFSRAVCTVQVIKTMCTSAQTLNELQSYLRKVSSMAVLAASDARSLTHLAESFSQATNYVAIAKHLGDMLVMHYFAVRNLVPDLFLVRRVASLALVHHRPIDRSTVGPELTRLLHSTPSSSGETLYSPSCGCSSRAFWWRCTRHNVIRFDRIHASSSSSLLNLFDTYVRE